MAKAKLKIKAEKIEAIHLSYGDLYSMRDAEFWNSIALGADQDELHLQVWTGHEEVPKWQGVTVFKITIIKPNEKLHSGVRIRLLDPHNPPGVKGMSK